MWTFIYGFISHQWLSEIYFMTYDSSYVGTEMRYLLLEEEHAITGTCPFTCSYTQAIKNKFEDIRRQFRIFFSN